MYNLADAQANRHMAMKPLEEGQRCTYPGIDEAGVEPAADCESGGEQGVVAGDSDTAGVSLSAAGPSARQHHPLVATGTCCTGDNAKTPLSHCRAITVLVWAAPLSGPKIRMLAHVGRDTLVGLGSLVRDRWCIFRALGLSPFCGAM